MFKSESIVNLAASLVKAQRNLGVAMKDSKNPFYKSSYADLNSVIEAVVPTFNEQGIAILQTPDVITLNDGSQVQVIQTMLIHETGEYIAGNTQVVTAKDRDPQSMGSAITYSRRYGLQSLVTLRASDDDGEAAMSRTPQKERIDEVLQSTVATPPVIKKSSFKRSPQQQGNFGT